MTATAPPTTMPAPIGRSRTALCLQLAEAILGRRQVALTFTADDPLLHARQQASDSLAAAGGNTSDVTYTAWNHLSDYLIEVLR